MTPKEATCGKGARTRDGFVVKNCNFFCTNLAPRTKGVFYSILDKIAYTQILSFSKSFYKYFDNVFTKHEVYGIECNEISNF